jgi:chemotaxis protein histidine kinase CheA
MREVTAVGGTIEIASPLDRGTALVVSLPVEGLSHPPVT